MTKHSEVEKSEQDTVTLTSVYVCECMCASVCVCGGVVACVTWYVCVHRWMVGRGKLIKFTVRVYILLFNSNHVCVCACVCDNFVLHIKNYIIR